MKESMLWEVIHSVPTLLLKIAIIGAPLPLIFSFSSRSGTLQYDKIGILSCEQSKRSCDRRRICRMACNSSFGAQIHDIKAYRFCLRLLWASTTKNTSSEVWNSALFCAMHRWSNIGYSLWDWAQYWRMPQNGFFWEIKRQDEFWMDTQSLSKGNLRSARSAKSAPFGRQSVQNVQAI